MNFLFVHQNFPGQFLRVAAHLAASGAHNVLFVSEPNGNQLRGVRRLTYQALRGSTPGIHPAAVEFETAMIRAETVGRTCAELSRLGYRPDIVIGHNGWGELLQIKDVWPDVPLDGYFEFYYRPEAADVGFDPEFPVSDEVRARVRMKNAVNLLGLEACDRAHTPTPWQRSTYPDWAQERIRIVPEGLDLDCCHPDPGARFVLPETGEVLRADGTAPVVTYVARNLEPYRGFHVFMRMLPALLRARPDLRVVVAGGEGVSYGTPPPEGTWRSHMLRELGGTLDPGRVAFVGRLDYAAYLALLQVSWVHVYLTYPFVASWSLREAMACGCCVLGSDTAPVRDFIAHEETGVLAPFHDPARLADEVLHLLEDAPRRRRLGARAAAVAREWTIERHVGGLLDKPA